MAPSGNGFIFRKLIVSIADKSMIFSKVRKIKIILLMYYSNAKAAKSSTEDLDRLCHNIRYEVCDLVRILDLPMPHQLLHILSWLSSNSIGDCFW